MMVSGFVPSKSFAAPEDTAWLGPAPVIGEEQIVREYRADVVIIGSGHAGLQAAWAAACGGASVLVLEGQNEEHFFWWGEQIASFNSQFLIERGFGPFDEEDVIAEFMKCSAHRADPALIAQFVHHSGEMLDAVLSLVPEDSPILENLTIQRAFSGTDRPTELGGYKTWPGTVCLRKGIYEEPRRGVGAYSNFGELNRLVMADAKKHGARWFFNHSAVVLDQDGETGAVRGVIALDRATGEYYRFRAPHTVLAAGDFGANAAMVAALLDEVAEWGARRGQEPQTLRGIFGRNGSGIKMGLWAGGHLQTSPRALSTFPRINGPFGGVPFVYLNCKGERFCNETIHAGIPPRVYEQPVGMVCTVFDATWREQIESLSMCYHGNPDFGVPAYIEQGAADMEKVLASGHEGYFVRSFCNTERDGGVVYGANTLPELADILGYKGQAKETFLRSIERYNAFCKAGRDPDFAREGCSLWPVECAPFYATRGNNEKVDAGLNTISGLMTDRSFRLLNDRDEPIEGVYAVGNCLGGRYALIYATPISGNTIGMAMTHGRLLGKQLAASCTQR